jgi:hypothetical protein
MQLINEILEALKRLEEKSHEFKNDDSNKIYSDADDISESIDLLLQTYTKDYLTNLSEKELVNSKNEILKIEKYFDDFKGDY